jgi:hypothetical protein
VRQRSRPPVPSGPGPPVRLPPDNKHTNKNNGNFLSEKLVVFTNVRANLSTDTSTDVTDTMDATVRRSTGLSTDLTDTMDATVGKDDAAAPVPGATTSGCKRKAHPPADSCGGADGCGAPSKTPRLSKPQKDADRAEKELAAARQAMQAAVDALDHSPDDPLLQEQAAAAVRKYKQQVAFSEYCRAAVQLAKLGEQLKLPGADAAAIGAERSELMAVRKLCMRRMHQYAKPPLVVRSEATAAPCAQPAAPCAQPAAPASASNQRTVAAQALGALPVRTVEGAGFTMRVFDPKGANAFLEKHLGFRM